jgi:hypothetical protein
MRRLEGTPIAELVDGGRLKSADILLEHSRGSLWAWLIRLGTGNYWNHALMVCSVRDVGNNNDKALIIDPRMGRIYTIGLREYFERFKHCDISVRRFETDWFQGNSPTDESRFPRVVSEFALRRIDDKSIAARPLGLVRRTLRRLSIVYRFISRKRKFPRLKKTAHRTKPLNLNTYSCSGVVQWSYYRGVARVLTKEGLAKSRLQEVIFSPRLAVGVSDADLLSITPADLARCAGLSWKYVVRKGVVWEVANEEEVNSIISSKKLR